MGRPRKRRGQVVGKYNAKGEHVTIDGKEVWIPSAAQAERARQLIALREAGTIDGLRLEMPVPLDVNGRRVCIYKVDAAYDVVDPRGAPLRRVYEEVKGLPTADWRLKKKLFEAVEGVKLSVIQVADRKEWPNERGYSSAQWMRDNWAGRLPD